MHNRSKHTYCASLFFLLLILLFGSSCLLTGCSGGTSSTAEANAGNSVSSRSDGSGNSGSDADSSGQKRADAYASLVPTASGETCYGDDSVSIDASNISDGYMMIRYTGRSEKAKAQITIPDGTVYTYTIKGSDYNTFPLTGGNGDYTLKVYEWVVDNSYALAFSGSPSASAMNSSHFSIRINMSGSPVILRSSPWAENYPTSLPTIWTTCRTAITM